MREFNQALADEMFRVHPEWMYITCDNNGEAYWYDTKPTASCNCSTWFSDSMGDMGFIGTFECADWTKAFYARERVPTDKDKGKMVYVRDLPETDWLTSPRRFLCTMRDGSFVVEDNVGGCDAWNYAKLAEDKEQG